MDCQTIKTALGYIGITDCSVHTCAIGMHVLYEIYAHYKDSKYSLILDYCKSTETAQIGLINGGNGGAYTMMFEQVTKAEDLVQVFKTFFSRVNTRVLDVYDEMLDYCLKAGLQCINTNTFFEARRISLTSKCGYHILINKKNGNCVWERYIAKDVQQDIYQGCAEKTNGIGLEYLVEAIWQLDRWLYHTAGEVKD